MGDVRQSQMVARAQELRRDARIARRAARVPTSGSASVDRMLLTLAEQREHDASILEQESTSIRSHSAGALLRRSRIWRIQFERAIATLHEIAPQESQNYRRWSSSINVYCPSGRGGDRPRRSASVWMEEKIRIVLGADCASCGIKIDAIKNLCRVQRNSFLPRHG